MSTLVSDFQEILRKDTDTKALNDSAVKIQNRMYLLERNDPQRGAKLKGILANATSIYPVFKAKIEEARIKKALLEFDKWSFYEKLTTADFGEYEADLSKSPPEIIQSKLDKIIESLTDLPKRRAMRNKRLATALKNYRALDKAMKIYLGALEGVAPLSDLRQTDPKKRKKKEPMSEIFKKHAKFSTVNGKSLIAIDETKVDIWGSTIIQSSEIETPPDAKSEKAKKDGEKKKKAPPKEIRVKKPQVIAPPPPPMMEIRVEPVTPPKKRNVAVGFIDDQTIAFGYEKEIKEILSRESSYKNTRAAEMIDTFKDPLVSFAISSDLISKFMGAFSSVDLTSNNESEEKTKSTEETESDEKKSESEEKDENTGEEKTTEKSEKDEKEKDDKKPTQSERFLKDLNIFGALEYEGTSPETQDVIFSLGFTKNKVEDIFKEEPPEDENSAIELGEFRILTNVFYDLLNSLKVFKASLSFKFEKKKVAAIIENAPNTIREARINPEPGQNARRVRKKREIRSLSEFQKLLGDPAFYQDILKMIAK